ncbi:MAG: hypothetical protein KF712_12460 [Akkermansiaceae bacterium]|nr:hypothetical protein [Akkermansiaceae bacterium]
MKFLLILLLLPAVSGAAEIREEKVHYANADFRVVRIEPDDLKVVWKDSAGEIFGTFDKVQEDFSKKGRTVRFLMNGGIFEPGCIPSGLLAQDWKVVLPLNTKDGKGNFFLKPNGVVSMWIGGHGGPQVSTVEDWKARYDLSRRVRDLRAPNFAVQSGPLLLIGGKRHPAFKEGSESRLHRTASASMRMANSSARSPYGARR